MSTGELKGILIKILQDLVGKHREARAKVTDEQIDAFMRVRPITVPIPPKAAAAAAPASTPAATDA